MANNAFNFKGIYDKIAGLLKNSDIVDPGEYTPTQNDYVAIYKDVPNSVGVGDSTISVKQYVSVTDIGTGGGGGGGGSMTSFDVTGEGGVVMSKNGGTFGQGPFTIENDDVLTIDSSSVPNGLNWRGDFSSPSSGTTFEINDVVYTTTGTTEVLYRTWFAIQQQNVSGAVPPPTGTEYSNDYWALLGTQGPPGPAGPIGTNAVAIYGFRSVTQAGGDVTNAINITGTPGNGTNSTGTIIKVNNTSTTTELVIVIGANYNQGWPDNSQITFVNISAEGNAPVKIVGATTPAVVTLNSADNAKYLRTTNSSCSIVRESTNIYWMFGDLTNIA